ncbi:hypothetical protein CR513_12151, partial [Mucuna pruriens]
MSGGDSTGEIGDKARWPVREVCVEPRKELVKTLRLKDAPTSLGMDRDHRLTHPNVPHPKIEHMEGNTCYYIRKLRPVPTRTPNIQFLQQWGSQLKGQWRTTFKRKYENLLSLVNIEVQPTALSTLTQYYDLPLRCFTFQGFQLAPPLEKYERLLGIPCDKFPPYLFRGHYPSWASVARLLKVPESKVLKLKKNQNEVEGIPKVALEERLQRLQEEEDW